MWTCALTLPCALLFMFPVELVTLVVLWVGVGRLPVSAFARVFPKVPPVPPGAVGFAGRRLAGAACAGRCLSWGFSVSPSVLALSAAFWPTLLADALPTRPGIAA